MAGPQTENRTDGQAGLFDWMIFAIVLFAGGASFAFIRGAVETIPPAIVTIGRLWIGALFLCAVMIHAGRKFPPLFVSIDGKYSVHQEWKWIIGISMIGYVVPFFIFPWAQQHIESGLAGVYMGFMPIWTVLFAYFFANETLGRNKIIGLMMGVIGLIVLLGPEVLNGIAQSDFIAQCLVLLATVCYGIHAVLTRRAPPIRPRIFAAGTILSAAIMSTPVLFLTPIEIDQWSVASIANLIALGLCSTGLVALLLIIIIQRVGAGFTGFVNYLTPVWAVILGALLFNERLEFSVLVALVIILIGVAVSRRREKPGH